MSNFKFFFTSEAVEYLQLLKKDKCRLQAFKAVSKALRFMQENLRHSSLQTHEFHSKRGPLGEKIFESYAHNRTPGAHRIFWFYGPVKDQITIFLISPHP